jgi:hypothetical protein
VSDSGSALEVPQDIQSIGVPATTAEFTQDQYQAVFVGKDKGGQTDAGSPEGVDLLAINVSDDDGDAWA